MSAQELLHKYVTPMSRLSSLPSVSLVVQTRNDGMIELQKSFFFPRRRYGDFVWVNPDKVSTFKVHRKDDKGILGEIVDHTELYEDKQVFDVDWGKNKITRENLEDLEILPDRRPLNYKKVREGAEEYERMREVSPRGLLPHVGILENTKRSIREFLTGVPVGVPEGQERIVLRERLTRPRGAPGVGTLEKRTYEKANYFPALNAGVLPYGPGEENFLGGSIEMARRGTRKSRNFGIFGRLYSPVGHLLAAGKESVGAVANTAKGVVGEGITGLDKIGKSVSGHANMAVRDLLKRKSRKTSGGRRGRKSRKASRKSRKTRRR